MGEDAGNLDVEQRISEHLGAVDRALASKGVPLTERRSVTRDVEAQIREMLTAGGSDTPTSAEQDSVLRKLDAPESYAEDLQLGYLAQPLLAAPLGTGGFSRTAVAGAASAAFVWLSVLGFFLFLLNGDMPPEGRVLSFVICPVLSLGGTILGWVAVGQIRTSAGRLHGMGLAVADGLLLPLIVLDALIAAVVWLPVAGIVTWMWPDINVRPIKYPFIAFDLVSVAAICALVDYRIVRWVWRKVKAPTQQ
jgi:hypothetical protein